MAEGTKKRKLNYEKCEYCRKDKQKCNPTTRTWPGQKCDGCSKQGLPCGPNSLPGRFKHRKQHGAPDFETPGSWKLPMSMIAHGTQQQDFSQGFRFKQPILERCLSQSESQSDFLLRTLDGAMLHNYTEILTSIIQNHLIDLDSTHLQEYVVKLVDWGIVGCYDVVIKSIILHCPKSAFEHTLEQRGIEMLDWAYNDVYARDLFRALLHWEIVYGHGKRSILLLRAIEERFIEVGDEVAKLLLRFSGIREQFTDMHRQGRESHTSSSTSDSESVQEDGDDDELGHTHQLDDLRTKVIRKADRAKLPLPPITIPAGYLLHVAIHSGQLEAAKQLLCSAKSGGMSQDSTTLNYKDSEGRTPLMAAVRRGDEPDFINLLLEQHGVDVNAHNNLDQTALILATLYGDRNRVRSLLRHPAVNPNVKGRLGDTAIMSVARWGYVEDLTDLLHHPRLDINVQDRSGKTALHYAMKRWQRLSDDQCSEEAGMILLLLQDSRTWRLPDNEGNFPNVSLFLQKHFWNRDIPGHLSRWST